MSFQQGQGLTAWQQDVMSEYIGKGSGGLSIPMGGGKTVIALALALHLSPCDPIIIVVSKTLICSWEKEICKFFGKTVPYEVLHQERIRDVTSWALSRDTRIVITTSEFLTRVYRSNGIEQHFVYQQPNRYVGYTNIYTTPDHPLLSPALVQIGPGTLYALTFGCLIVDEAHGFCNILVEKCRCIASLCAKHRWLLSGTLFSEPKPANLLGYYVLLNHPDNPRDLVSMTAKMRRRDFPGLQSTLVRREKAQDEDEALTYEVRRRVIQEPLTEEEAKVYGMCKDMLRTLDEELKRTQNTERRRRYAAYLLAMITYLRQMLIAPIIVLASVALDVCRLQDGSNLSRMIMTQMEEAGLMTWLDSPESLYSSRCKAVMRELEATKAPRVLIFSAFRTSLRLLSTLIKEAHGDRWEHFELEGNMSLQKKKELLDSFEACPNGLLFLTYKTGSEGLNLQHTDTVFLVDTLWNATAASQAIARVARRGQTSAEINVLTFISDTGIEKAIYEKQINKIEISDDLLTGPTMKRYHQMKTSERPMRKKQEPKLSSTEESILAFLHLLEVDISTHSGEELLQYCLDLYRARESARAAKQRYCQKFSKSTCDKIFCQPSRVWGCSPKPWSSTNYQGLWMKKKEELNRLLKKEVTFLQLR